MLRPAFHLLRLSALATAALCALLAQGCAIGRPPPEASAATSEAERIAELEARVARDRAVLERYVSATDPVDLPSPETLREIAWRLPDYQRELAKLRGDPTERAPSFSEEILRAPGAEPGDPRR